MDETNDVGGAVINCALILKPVWERLKDLLLCALSAGTAPVVASREMRDN